jgi:sarcosine oxidase subunit beta
METADIVIVGAGTVGCSIAYHLIERRAGKVVVLERNTIGSGTTAKGNGGVRLQFSTVVNIQLSLEAVSFFEQFAERFGVDPEYQQRGYLFLAQDEDLLEIYRRNVMLQRQYDVPSYEVRPDEISELAPYLYVDDVLGGTYCPKDGRANPQKVIGVFVDGARRLGAEIREGVTVTDLRRSEERVTGVQTTTGEIESPVVVNACGPWAAALSAMAGVDEPVTPHRRQQFVTEPTPIENATPFIIDGDRSFSFHSVGDQLRVGMSRPGDDTGWDDRPEWEMLPLIRQRLAHRAPMLGDLRFVDAYAGLYEMSPDLHGIVGWAPGVAGLILCNGFSGHGFMHSPIIGRLVAEIILDGAAHTIDISALSPSRFIDGALATESLGIV